MLRTVQPNKKVSKLQNLVADKVGIEVGTYYHYAHNLHLYNNIIEKL